MKILTSPAPGKLPQEEPVSKAELASCGLLVRVLWRYNLGVHGGDAKGVSLNFLASCIIHSIFFFEVAVTGEVVQVWFAGNILKMTIEEISLED